MPVERAGCFTATRLLRLMGGSYIGLVGGFKGRMAVTIC